MHNFNFRAYVPRPEPATAPPRNSEYNARGSGPNAATSSVFRSYIPPGSAQGPAIFSHVVPPAQSSSSTFKTFNPPPVVSPNVKRGSYEYDLASGDYPLSWASFSDLKAWLRAEEVDNTIELLLKEVVPNKGKGVHHWQKKHIYVCARMGTGGKSKYVPKMDQGRKIGSKRTPCPCRVVVKSYPEMTTLLGKYESEHSHPIGSQNLKYTHIPDAVLHQIEDDLRRGVRPEIVLARARGGVHTEQNLPLLLSQAPRREEFIRQRDVRRIQKKIEAETIRLDPHDGKSTLQWVEHLRAIDALMFFKASCDPPPADSDVESDAFLLGIQTPYQRKCFRAWGHDFAGLDATHNTTYYAGMLLFTIIVRDRHAHGMPIAWMIASNGQAVTIDYLLMHLKRLNPGVDPNKFMSDNDSGQLGRIRFRYSLSHLLLCWWHVLHAWQQHFVTRHYPELCEKLKGWIRITNEAEFWVCWEEIKSLAPDSVIEYLQTYYLVQETLEMWSAVYRTDRNIFRLCDTNMLVEAWHHVLKSFHMDGKRNRRVDQLIHTLINVALPDYIANHRAQQFGFHGPDLALQRHNAIHKTAAKITSEMIQEVEAGRLFTVKSQSTPGLSYTVDLEAYTCHPCPSFPEIQFCKHICAVEDHFPDLVVPRSLPVASQPWDEVEEVPQTARLSNPHSAPAPVARAVTQDDAHLLQAILNKLHLLERSRVTLPEPLTTSLRVLDGALGDTTNGAEILPRTVQKVASNQGTASETASVMGTQRKGAKKRKNVDPYGAGQASGKSAKDDARGGKKARIDPSTPEDTENLDFGVFADLVTPDLSLPSAPAVDSPQNQEYATPPPPFPPLASSDREAQLALLDAIARHNAMYPPDVPQRTSYYRENYETYVPTTGDSYYRTR